MYFFLASDDSLSEIIISKNVYGDNNIEKVIGYEIPLKNSDKGLGKIDLISITDEIVHLIELRKPSNDKSILRAILEIQTYSEQLDTEKLKNNFQFSLIMKLRKPFLFLMILNSTECYRI